MNSQSFQILIVEDEPLFAEGIEQILKLEGYQVSTVNSCEEALSKIKWKAYDLILSDLMLPGLSGMDLLKKCREEQNEQAFVMMTAYATVPTAIEAMKLGASGYYVKGNSLDELIEEVKVVFEQWRRTSVQRQEQSQTAAKLLESKNIKFVQIVEMAKRAAASNANILLLGESGVGKEVFANFIHEVSGRKTGPQIAVNCQSLSDQVLESELFGHMKGAFTGAFEDRIGRFEAASGGTLFLDEIADVSLATQVKLLRVLESKKIERLGANQSIFSDFRLVTATNKNIEELIEQGKFREDFYYRISTVVIPIPPLRERPEDLPKLVDFFVETTCEAMGIKKCKVLPEAMEKLAQYPFPGNIRELKNMIQRLVIFSENGEIGPEGLNLTKPTTNTYNDLSTKQSLRDFRAEMEKQFILNQLERHGYSMTLTAEAIGITRRQLFNKMKVLEIDKSVQDE